MVSAALTTMGSAVLALNANPAEVARNAVDRTLRMRVLHRYRNDSPPAGSPPPHRYTPPEARVQSRRRPVSWLAGLSLASPSRRIGNGCLTPGSPRTVAGAAA